MIGKNIVGKNTLACKMEMFAFVAINFEPIGILTHSAHQNDRLNLSFVKDKHTVSKNMARNGYKMGIHFVIFISKRVYFNKEKYIETRVWVATDFWVVRSHMCKIFKIQAHAHPQVLHAD